MFTILIVVLISEKVNSLDKDSEFCQLLALVILWNLTCIFAGQCLFDRWNMSVSQVYKPFNML